MDEEFDYDLEIMTLEAELSALQEENRLLKYELDLKRKRLAARTKQYSKLSNSHTKLKMALEFIASCNPDQYKSRTDIVYSIAEKSFERARKALETK